jgi:hypothetical protein
MNYPNYNYQKSKSIFFINFGDEIYYSINGRYIIIKRQST